MPRLLRPLLLALLLVAPAAFAEALYRVDLIVFRQGAQAVSASQPAPEDWAGSAAGVAALDRRTPALAHEAERLQGAAGYQILLHQAWQQAIGSRPARVSFSDGAAHDGQFPVQGVLELGAGRHLDLRLSAWVNRFDRDGLLLGSERLQVQRRLVPGQLTYLDHPSLGVLLRVSPL